MLDASIIIPLFNEEESLPELLERIGKVMKDMDLSYEVLMVDDGSTDSSWSVIQKLAAEDSHIRGLSFRRNYGKSAALYCGFARAEGNVVFTMDADLQDRP